MRFRRRGGNCSFRAPIVDAGPFGARFCINVFECRHCESPAKAGERRWSDVLPGRTRPGTLQRSCHHVKRQLRHSGLGQWSC